MSGEKNLEKLLSTMSPLLIAGEFVFCTFKEARYGEHSELEPIAAFTESEGLTLVIPKSKADEYEIEYESCFRCITLTVVVTVQA